MTNAAKARELLVGAVDQHVHSGPSVIPREVDHIDVVEDASAAGISALVLKDHYYATGPCAALINRHYADRKVRVIGGIVLNNYVGGFNASAVEHEAVLGGRIVWLPTVSAENHIRVATEQAKKFDHPSKQAAISEAVPVLPLDGKVLRDEVKAVLDVIAEHDMVLAGGHLHVSEIWLVFEEAKRRGVKRFLINHPESIIQASMNDVQGFVSFGAYIEHSMVRFVKSSSFRKYEPDLLDTHIKAAGAGMTILASDLGQKGTVRPAKGMEEAAELCLDLGYTPADVTAMISTNPKALLGLH